MIELSEISSGYSDFDMDITEEVAVREGEIITKDNKFGFTKKEHRNGELILKYSIEPIYDSLCISNYNKLLARKKNKWGVMDFNETKILPYKYDNILPQIYDNNHFAVQYKGRWGIVNEAKHKVLPFEYDRIALPQYSGYIIVKDGFEGFFDPIKEVLIEPKYLEIVGFSYNNLSKVATKNGMVGYIDLRGIEYFED